MRLQGRVSEWNDERGFGFVTQNGTGARAFFHVSALTDKCRRPIVGSLVTYELEKDARGRLQAREAKFVGADRAPTSKTTRSLSSIMLSMLVLLVAGYVGYVRFSSPNSTVPASIYKIGSAREAARVDPKYQCQPEKNSCTKMTSCEEALFHQERCGVQGMDGDHDGVPCEQQWCK
jgi:cold shock CspA family protein